MSHKNFAVRFTLAMVVAVMLGVVPMFGASAVIGSVAGSTNATVGGQNLLPNTTLLSGDTLRVNNGAAVVAMGMGSRMVFAHDTVATFTRQAEEVTVSLGQGNVSLYHPEDGVAMRVKIGAVSVVAGKGYKTVGDVAMVNGAIVVSAKEGMLRVEGPERSVEVTKGKTIAIMAEKKPAGSPQTASSHWNQSEVVATITLAATGVNTVLAVVNIHKTNQAKDEAAQADADAKQADADAKAAIAAANTADADAKQAAIAANAAGVVASQACLLISPTDPACVFTPVTP
jgi:hypothetical protein